MEYALKQPYRRYETALLYVTLLLLLLALLLKIGVNPLYMEEPRRALIGLEMAYNGNLWVPTEMGELYFKKPPVFNWLLLAAFGINGGPGEIPARMITVISLLGMGWLVYRYCKAHYSRELGVAAGLFSVVAVDLFFSTGLLGEIDTFYSLITLAAILGFYRLGTGGNPWLYIPLIYGLIGIGTLTKGLPSPVFLVMSGAVWLWMFRDFKKLFSLAHLVGILLFGAIVGGYLWIYSQYEDPSGYWNGLWSQASKRTVIENSWWDMIANIPAFPGMMIKDALPATLFLPLVLFRDARRKLLADKFLLFCLLAFLANALPYWVSPGTRSRYVSMLVPLLVILSVALWQMKREQLPAVQKVLQGFTIFLFGVLTLAFIAAPFAPQVRDLPGIHWLAIIGGPLMALATYAQVRMGLPALKWLILAVIIGRIGFDAVVLPLRVVTGEHRLPPIQAAEINAISRGHDLHLWQHKDDGNMSLALVYYIEQEREETLGMVYEKNCEDFFLAKDWEAKAHPHKVYAEYKVRLDNYYLFKFTGCDE